MNYRKEFIKITCSPHKPVIIVIALWATALVLAYTGPIKYEFGSLRGLIFVVASGLLLISGFLSGTKMATLAKPKRPEPNYRVYKLYKTISVASLVGALLLQIDYMIAGRSVLYSIDNVDQIRNQGFIETTTILTTIGYPLNCIVLTALLILSFLVLKKCHVSKVYILFNIISALSMASVSIIGTNRQMILAFFIMILVIFCMISNRHFLKIINKTNILIKLLIISLTCLSLVYFIYISRYRGTEDYAIWTFQRTELNYEIPLLNRLEPGNEAAVYSLFFYATHSIPNATRLLEHLNEPFNLRPIMLHWYIIQSARFLPIYSLPRSLESQRMLALSGVSSYQWPTVLFTVYGAYGIIGGFMFLFGYGLLWGFSVQQWHMSIRLIPMIATFLFTFAGIFSIMYLPNETYFHANLLLFIAIFMFKNRII